MTESRKEKLKDYVKPMTEFFKKKKDIELTESQLGDKFKLAGNEVRYVISHIRHNVPNILNLRDRVYMLTNNKGLIQLEIKKMDKNLKPKYIRQGKLKKMIKGA